MTEAVRSKPSTLRRLVGYFRGTIVRPRDTFDELARQPGIRWAVIVSCLPVLQVWGNILLHTVFSLDWLGTRNDLPEPTFVFAYGQVQVGLEHWVPVFAALMPLLGLIGLVFVPGITHLLSKLWGGQGTFEQMVNILAFSTAVPNIVIGAASEWLFGVPVDLISGHGYWWTAAMQGEFGPLVSAIWNVYVLGFYIGFQWVWMIVLGTIGIRRVQRIPAWSAALIMVVTLAVWQFVGSVFVR